jgi:hypothetical protein
MAINLYRWHRPDCEARYPEPFRPGEFEERKRGWKRCACVIFASGALAGKLNDAQPPLHRRAAQGPTSRVALR